MQSALHIHNIHGSDYYSNPAAQFGLSAHILLLFHRGDRGSWLPSRHCVNRVNSPKPLLSVHHFQPGKSKHFQNHQHNTHLLDAVYQTVFHYWQSLPLHALLLPYHLQRPLVPVQLLLNKPYRHFWYANQASLFLALNCLRHHCCSHSSIQQRQPSSIKLTMLQY